MQMKRPEIKCNISNC